MTDQVLQPRTDGQLVPYHRGIPASQILKGTLSRFLPGSVVGTTGLSLVLDLSARGGFLETVAVIAGLAGGMAVGFGIGLFGMRRWLFPDARPDRNRSFLAGLLAPLATFAGLALGLDFALLPVISVSTSLVIAVVLFFAWLSPTPESIREPGFVDESPG